MADTQRTVAAVLALLADNTAGAISPQDLRDAFVSWRNAHGELSISAANRAAVTIAGTVNYYEVTNPVWTLSSDAYLFNESGGNGRLTYTGTVDIAVRVHCTVSVTSGSNSQVLHLRLGKSGTTIAESESQDKLGIGADVRNVSCAALVHLTTGQYLSLWIRNETGANNVTIECANLSLLGIAQ